MELERRACLLRSRPSSLTKRMDQGGDGLSGLLSLLLLSVGTAQEGYQYQAVNKGPCHFDLDCSLTTGNTRR